MSIIIREYKRLSQLNYVPSPQLSENRANTVELPSPELSENKAYTVELPSPE